MSNPDTNIETQTRHHRPSLIGIGLAVGAAAVAFLAWIALVAADGNTPGERPVVSQEEVAPGVVVEERLPAANSSDAAPVAPEADAAGTAAPAATE